MIEDEVLRSQFRSATEDRLQKLEAGLLHLEQQADDGEILETLLQELRSLKSDSNRVSLDAVTTLTQQVETLLESLHREEIPLTMEVSDRLHDGLNTISQLVYEAVTGEPAGVDMAEVGNSLITDPVLSVTDPWQEDSSEMDSVFHSPTAIIQAQEFPVQEPSAQEFSLQDALSQEPPTQENSAQEPLLQGPPTQENPTQEPPAQEFLVQEPLLQEPLDPENSVQEPLDLENLFQGTPPQEIPVQELPDSGISAQESPTQETLFQESKDQQNLAQEPPSLDTLFQGNPVQETLLQEPSVQASLFQESRVQENSAQELPSLDNLFRETPAQETPAHEPLGPENLVQEPPAQDNLFQELPAQENSAQEALAQDQDNLLQGTSDPENILQPPPAQDNLLQEPLELENSAQEPPDQDNLFQEPLELENVAQEPLAQDTLLQGTPDLENVAQEPLTQNTLFQEPLEPENSAQESPAQENLLQESLLQDNLFQVHGTPAQENSTQEPPSLDNLFQGTPDQKNLFQELPAQENLFQEPLELEHSTQESPAQKNLFQERPDQGPLAQENSLQESPAQEISAPDLLESYKATNQKRLQHLESGLLQLATVADDELFLKDLLQEIHCLKCDSRQVGMETMVTLAQQFENVLEGVQRKKLVLSIELCAHLYEALKAMEQWVNGVGPDVSEVLGQTTVPQDPPEALTEPAEDPPEQSVVAKIDALLQSIPTISEDAELREIYKSISEGRLQKLEASLAQLEKQPDDAILAELLREAHSLKGDSRSVGINAVEILTHNFEGILVGVQNRQIAFTPALSHSLYLGLAAISQMVNEASIHPANGEAAPPQPNSLTAATSESAAVDEQFTVSSLAADTTPQPQPAAAELDAPCHPDTICVQTSDLDILMSQVEELAIARLQVAHTAAQFDQMAMIWEEWSATRNQEPSSPPSSASSPETQIENLIAALKTSAQANSAQLGLISEDLREGIGALKLLPLSSMFERFPRLVQDLASQQSKQVELEIEGEEITIDKRIFEDINDALMHLICNAIDHGVETPAERKSKHKPPTAKICLRGYQTDTGAVLEVIDDGRGLDIEQIKQTAINRQLYCSEELEAMTVDQIQALILESGFSTRTVITELSGRGIGLDVVRSHIERLRGHVQIDSTPGQGCTFRLKLSPNHEDEASGGVVNDPCFVH